MYQRHQIEQLDSIKDPLDVGASYMDRVSTLSGCVIFPASFHWFRHKIIITERIQANVY